MPCVLAPVPGQIPEHYRACPATIFKVPNQRVANSLMHTVSTLCPRFGGFVTFVTVHTESRMASALPSPLTPTCRHSRGRDQDTADAPPAQCSPNKWKKARPLFLLPVRPVRRCVLGGALRVRERIEGRCHSSIHFVPSWLKHCDSAASTGRARGAVFASGGPCPAAAPSRPCGRWGGGICTRFCSTDWRAFGGHQSAGRFLPISDGAGSRPPENA